MKPHRHVGWGVLLVWVFLVWNSETALTDTIRLGSVEYYKLNDFFNDQINDESRILLVENNEPISRYTLLVLEGESTDQWTEALEIIVTLRMNAPKKVKKWYKGFQKQGDSRCPSEWRLLAEERKSLTFERISEHCPPLEAQHALFRVLYGKPEVFLLIATVKGTMDETTRSHWLAVLKSTKVCKRGKC